MVQFIVLFLRDSQLRNTLKLATRVVKNVGKKIRAKVIV